MRDSCRCVGRGAWRAELSPLLATLLGWITVVLFCTSVWGVPYASCLTNASGLLSFRLNESADQVDIISEGGAVTNRLGPLPSGLHAVPLSATGAFQVVVFKVSPLGFLTPLAANQAAVLQISQDTLLTRFNSPRGLAVNTDPATPCFGRVYVANSAAGAATNSLFGSERQLGDGIYALNSDLTDAVGQGEIACTGGLGFTNSDLAPSRLTVGGDGFLYVCDPSEASGSLYRLAPDLAAGSGMNVLGGPASGAFPVGLVRNHGGISAAVLTGSLQTTNLMVFVIDEDLQIDPNTTLRSMLNSLWVHELYEIPGSTSFPGLVIRSPWLGLTPQTMDLSHGTNDLFYVTDYRGDSSERAGLYVVSRFGDLLWNSLEQSRALLADPAAEDLLGGAGGSNLDPATSRFAVMNQDTNAISLLRLDGGLPDLASRLEFVAFADVPGLFCDLAFDAAGNLYAISAGAQSLRVFSPGGVTTAITGSDGSFKIIRPSAITVAARTPLVRENAHTNAVFVLHRTGALDRTLEIFLELGGSARAGADYQAPPPTATFPAGVAEIDVPILLLDDEIPERTETVTLRLLGASFYDLGHPSAATLVIQDDDAPLVQITATQTNAHERLSGTLLRFELERLGETNSAFSVSYDLTAGTARPGDDFVPADGGPIESVLRFAPGESRRILAFRPKDDAEVEETESVIVRLLQATNPALSVPMQAVAWITDDDSPVLPPASSVFSEDFEDSTRATNWVIRFGANNRIVDAFVGFGLDYTTLGVPPSPGSSPGRHGGLVLEVNKTNSTPGGSSGINLYPRALQLEGDFALRFDLFMNLGPFAQTEYALAGLNHSGQFTNRLTRSFDPLGTARGGDGIWIALNGDGTDTNSCAAYSAPFPSSIAIAITNRPPSELIDVFPSPPYARPGAPGVEMTGSGDWTQVEFSQVRRNLSLRLNNRLVYSFTNTTAFTSGTIMLGLNDPFDSIGLGGAEGTFVVFDNVRVFTFAPAIRSLSLSSSDELRIEFVSPASGHASDFRVESSLDLAATSWQEVSAALVTSLPDGFLAQLPRPAERRFFRIKLQNAP